MCVTSEQGGCGFDRRENREPPRVSVMLKTSIEIRRNGVIEWKFEFEVGMMASIVLMKEVSQEAGTL
ncbi:hypothetical protein TNCV_3838861 [Trichonephila clavipes]|nr:hypothetical protein TNCV_3838861 [Trichonephila clavipes]